MSFQNFGDGSAQPQQAPEEQAGYGGPGAPQQHPMGQQMDPSQQQGQFPGGPQQQGQFPGGPQQGAPGAPDSQGGGDQKTTLWYVLCAHLMWTRD